LLLVEELAERGFLIVAALEDESDARGELRFGDGAAIELGASESVHVAAKRHAIGFVDGLRDARGDAWGLRNFRSVALWA